MKVEKLPEIPSLNAKDGLIDITDQKGELVPKSNFQSFLEAIQPINDFVSNALAEGTDVTEKEIKELNKKVKPAREAMKIIKQADKFIKDFYKDECNQKLEELHQIEKKYGYDELLTNVTKIKRRSEDIINQRAQSRWDELETLFDATLKSYPDLKDLPFKWFKERNRKLISGAATRKVRESDKMEVTNQLNQLNSNVSQIKQFIAQKLIDGTAKDQFIAEFKESVMDPEDGGLIKFNELITNALSATQKNQLDHLAKNDDSTSDDVVASANGVPVTDPSQFNEVDIPVDNADSTQPPADLTTVIPDDDLGLPPITNELNGLSSDEIDFNEEQASPFDDPKIKTDPTVTQIIKDATASDSQFHGILNDETKLENQKALINVFVNAMNNQLDDDLAQYIRNTLDDSQIIAAIGLIATL